MSEPEQWVGLEDVPSIADESWLYGPETNGTAPIDDGENSWTPQNLAELDDEPPVRPTLGDLGIVYPGKRHVFSGPQESAKTLAAYVIGLQVVRSGAKVVLIDFEMGPWDAKTRLRELGATDEELAGFLYVEPDVPAGDGVSRLVEARPGLVLVDAAAGAFQLEGFDDNSRKEVEKWANAWITPFWKAGIATIVLDHVTKNAETRGKYAIGSERKVGGADVHLGFEVVTPIKRGGHGLYKIVTHKDRGGFLKRGKLAEFELTSDPETHRIEWAFKAPVEGDEDAPFRPTHLMEKVSRYVEQQYEPVSQRAVERVKLGKAQFVRDALKLLVDDGFVERSEGPNGYLHESIRPYREDDDRGASRVRPGASPDGLSEGASLRPPPVGGRTHPEVRPETREGASQGSLDEDDEIPF